MKNKYYLLALQQEGFWGVYNVVTNDTPGEYLLYERTIKCNDVKLVSAIEISKEEYEKLRNYI